MTEAKASGNAQPSHKSWQKGSMKMAFVGTIGDKINVSVEVKGIHSYIDYSFGYRGTTKYIYVFEDEAGNVYTWNTASFSDMDKNDIVKIKAEIKAHKVYKEQEQTALKRVKVIEILAKGLSEDYIKDKMIQKKHDEQMASMQEGDFIFVMPYRQYKERYADCETIAGSYVERNPYVRDSVAMISVLIRKGRLVPSGVRGEHFSGYEIHFDLDGKRSFCTYRAVNEENALNRCKKDFPAGKNFECEKIYHNRNHKENINYYIEWNLGSDKYDQ